MTSGEHRARHGTSHGPRPPVDASMGLLRDLMASPVEAGYAEAARRRARAGGPAARTGRATLSLLMATVLGVVTVTAVTTLRQPRSEVERSRALLEEEIADRTADAEGLARANEDVTAEIAALQQDALATANPGLFRTLQEVELLSGAVAVTGPGLVVQLEDAAAPDGEEVEAGSRVQDLDLQIVANALWAAGAEAIAINGQRLTAVTAIRSAGQAILVDLAPLVGPYRVEAIGDVRATQTAFARSTAATHLSTVAGTYGIRVAVTAEQRLELPGGAVTRLHHAGVLGGVASSAPDGGGEP